MQHQTITWTNAALLSIRISGKLHCNVIKIPMALCKTAVTPMHRQWSYSSLALRHHHNNFHSTKCISKCHLQKYRHFILASMCWCAWKQGWLIVSWTLQYKFQWNSNQNAIIFTQGNAFESGYKMLDILSSICWSMCHPKMVVYQYFVPSGICVPGCHDRNT